jgi:hypothetical protein
LKERVVEYEARSASSRGEAWTGGLGLASSVATKFSLEFA